MLSRQALRLPRATASTVRIQKSRNPRRDLATPAATSPSANDIFANGTNTYYAEEMYRHWRQDPSSVHASWDAYFRGLDKGLPSSSAFKPPPSLVAPPTDGAPTLHASAGGAELDDHLKASLLIPYFGSNSSIPFPPAGPTPCSCLPGARSSRR